MFSYRSRRRSGFTLVEMLLAASLFAILSSLTLTVFVSVTRSGQNFTVRKTLADDGQFLMNQLVRDIANNAIDYEEYFNRLVIGGDFGMNFGQYASQFYFSPKANNSSKSNNCDHTSSTDCINLGQNPPKFPQNNTTDQSIYAAEGNAFILPGSSLAGTNKTIFCKDYSAGNELGINKRNYACLRHLYLISPDAKIKTFIAPREFTADQAGENPVALTKTTMENMKQFPGLFRCPPERPCSIDQYPVTLDNIINAEGTVSLPDNKTIPDGGKLSSPVKYENLSSEKNYDFVPFTPQRINIQDVRFYISPVEDPRKAFAENNPGSSKTPLGQPSVTVVLKMTPKGESSPVLTLQREITPAIFEEVQSYPPKMKCLSLGQKNGFDGCSILRKQQ